MTHIERCPLCKGADKDQTHSIDKPCDTCQGTGWIRVEEKCPIPTWLAEVLYPPIKEKE